MRPRSFLRCVCLTAIALAIGTFDVQHTLIAADEVPVPAYEELLVAGMYPAGGQRGTSVTVEVWGASSARKGRELKGMDGARTLIIDGPPGITVRDVKNLSGSRMQATLDIAADAAPGRRMVRVQSDRVGATSGTWFVVGELPEVLESKRNNEPAEAMKVTAPVTVNGSIEETLDTDCFRFAAKAGQKIVAAVVAHAIDRHSRGRNTQGFIDVSLELLGPDGALVADAQDTVGLDPVIEYTAERDGDYTARVFLVGYLGCPEAVYRLALGETQFATALDPPGGQRGQTVSLNFTGPGVPADAKFSFQVPDDPRPVIWITPPGSASDVPFVLGNFPEMNEQEPNSELKSANPLKPGYTTNGRFNEAGDEDWYVIELAAKQRIKLDLVAQRYLREPVDTLLEVLDEKGVKVAGNDDLAVTDVEVLHDFDPFDSALSFDPPSAGKFYIKVSEQSGASGHRAAYRLTAFEPQPEFALHQWPDAVPIWGPGTTAAFCVTVDRQAVVGASDIELTITGLPPGWTGSSAVSLGARQPPHPYGKRVLMTITAPQDAPLGAVANFQVVGRVVVNGKTIERIAQPLTTYIPTDRTYTRWSMQSRAIVAAAQGPHLKTPVATLTVAQGSNTELPVELIGEKVDGAWALIANLAGSGFRCSLGVTQTVTVKDGRTVFPLTTEGLPPGVHGVVVARAWGSEVRQGMPGPCTPLVQVQVLAKKTDAAAK